MSNSKAITWHRLHPAMLWFQLAGILRRYFLFFVVGGVASSRGENLVNFILIFTAVALSIGLLRYFSYRYAIDDKHLIVNEGVFTKKSQRYLLDKINHVNRHQNPLASLMGIVKLELQQEASNVPALILPAVTSAQAVEIEAAVQAHSPQVALSQGNTPQKSAVNATDSDSHVLFRSTLAKSLLEGVSALPVRLLVVGGILYRFYGQALTPFILDEYALYLKLLNKFGIVREEHFWQFIAVSFVCVYLIALIVALVSAFLRWFRYRVTLKSELIFIVSGWFTRSTRIINPQQIQAVVGVANPLRRLLGLSQWQMVAPRPGRQRGQASHLIPIGDNNEITNVIPNIWPHCTYPHNDERWLPVNAYHKRRLWLLTFATLATAVCIFTAIDSYFNPLSSENFWQSIIGAPLAQQLILGVLTIVIFGWLARQVKRNYAGTGYLLEGEFLFIKSAFLSSRTFIVSVPRIQSVIFHQSIMQKRRALVTVELDINGILSPVRLYNIDRETAEALRNTSITAVNRHNI